MGKTVNNHYKQAKLYANIVWSDYFFNSSLQVEIIRIRNGDDIVHLIQPSPDYNLANTSKSRYASKKQNEACQVGCRQLNYHHELKRIQGTMTGLATEFEKVKTEVLIQYVVSESELPKALDVLRKFKFHSVATGVLRNYYAALPYAREEMACDLRVVAERQNTYLFALKTTDNQYLYLGTDTDVLYIGAYQQGISDPEILSFFGFKDAKKFKESVPSSFEELQPLQDERNRIVCVACGVAEGEIHILGCPVEQCPWCDGQLSRCNCRFDHLGVDEIDDLTLLEGFEELLERKGRIPFKKDQGPSFPIAGDDPGPVVSK